MHRGYITFYKPFIYLINDDGDGGDDGAWCASHAPNGNALRGNARPPPQIPR